MARYIFTRLLLVIPTLLIIITLNFFIVQLAPGGPVDNAIAMIKGHQGGAEKWLGNAGDNDSQNNNKIDYELRARLNKLYGYDQPLWQRYAMMLKNYALFDFGESFTSGRAVMDMVWERLPVSISLGVWSFLLIYSISLPLGIRKAFHNRSMFDTTSSAILILLHSLPAFLMAVLFIILFAGGRYFAWFPIRGLVSDNFHQLSLMGQIADYFWHIILPVFSMVLGGFASLTMLTKNSFLDEIAKHYVLLARAKGCNDRQIQYGHIFQNAMLIVIAGMPAALIGVLFTESLLIEIIFSLNGLGLLGFDAVLTRDYPVFFATLYIFTLIGLLLNIISDIMYVVIDPRIHFQSMEA